MIIRNGREEGTVLKPGCGGMQGDASMAEMFSAMYDPIVEDWIEEKKTQG